ncbi:MAG: DnaB-like helicase C-terminal domain-containing protein [bacterium]|nr:DnaB-like helicase C-terminal domain-containing protein [bacterium]
MSDPSQPEQTNGYQNPFPQSTPRPFGTKPPSSQPTMLRPASSQAPSSAPSETKVNLTKQPQPKPKTNFHPLHEKGAQLPLHQQAGASVRLPALLEDIAKGVYSYYIPTGFSNLDEKLAGGLRTGLYLLGGASSCGKTALAMSIADHIASQEQDVLFISLEMSAAELMLRSLSRIVAQQNNGTGFTYIDLLNDAAIQETRTQNAISYYEQCIAPHLHFFEGSGDFGTQRIRELTERHIHLTERIPVVIVDCLQALASNEILGADKSVANRVIVDLKRLSRDYHTTVFCISSLNSSYHREEVTIEAFNEAGHIENSCDAIFALQLEGQGQVNFDVQSALAATPRKMQLVCLKYRQGPQGWRLPLRYYPAVNLYTDMMNDIPAISKTNPLHKAVRAKLSPNLLPSAFASLFNE